MKSQIKNRIIIIGGNHQNTLAAIRCFGICGCDIHVLLHADKPAEKLSCAKTRFSKNRTSVVLPNETSIVEWLLDNKTEEKQILFPCSDLAEYAIDDNANELSQNFIFPIFDSSKGEVCSLMGKWNQYLFAKQNDIGMAESWLFELSDYDVNIVKYPCIVKPETSAFGVKGDITICKNSDELEEALRAFKNKNYEKVLVQELIQNANEYVSIGCIAKGEKVTVSDTLKKINTLQGNTTYAVFDDNKSIKNVNDRIFTLLKEKGYNGMLDIEYLLKDEIVYLLEINFRQSGIGFGQIDNKVYTPYIWALSAIGEEIPQKLRKSVKIGKTLIDETVCLTHRKQYGLSLFKWAWVCLTASAHAKYNIHDLRGTFASYIGSLRKSKK